MLTVRAADAGDATALSAALAQAFATDPVMNWLLPQRTRRVARRELMFKLELQTYVLPQDGLVFTTDDDRGGLAGGCLACRRTGGRCPGQWTGGPQSGGCGRSGRRCSARVASSGRWRSTTPPSRTPLAIAFAVTPLPLLATSMRTLRDFPTHPRP